MSDETVELFRFGNEYTSIRLLSRRTENGTRVLVRSDRTGYQVDLDAMELDAIASMNHEGLGRLVKAMTESGSANTAVGADAPGSVVQ